MLVAVVRPIRSDHGRANWGRLNYAPRVRASFIRLTESLARCAASPQVWLSGLAILGGCAQPGAPTASPAASPTPQPRPPILYRGVAVDPTGDSEPFRGSQVNPDLVTATVEVRADGVAIFHVTLQPTTYSPETTALQISLDTDQDPATGSRIFGAGDPLGADYFINVATGSQTGFFFMWKVEPPGQAPSLVAGTPLVKHRSDGVDFPVTHAAVLSPFSFRVLANTVLSLGVSTPIQDAMPNRDSVAVVH